MPKTYDEYRAEQRKTLTTGNPQPEGQLTPLRTPGVGEAVVDLARGTVGAYLESQDGRWQLTPLHGGVPWLADPVFVRTATVNECVRDGMSRAEMAQRQHDRERHPPFPPTRGGKHVNKSVEFNPVSHPGLEWSVASYSHLDDKVECFAVADAGNGLVALANINNDGAVITGTPGELRKLRDAFAAGQYDHLIGA